jgi:flagellar biosynthesis protein FlhF
MKIKRFFAADMRQAIRKVREEQGPDAVILSNRKVDGGVEIVSAVDYDEALINKALHESASTSTLPAPGLRHVPSRRGTPWRCPHASPARAGRKPAPRGHPVGPGPGPGGHEG